MNDSSDIYRRVGEFLSGEMNEAGRREFDAWVNASRENRALFDEMRVVWKHSGKRHSVEEVSTDEAWADFVRYRDEEPARPVFSILNSPALRIAASVLLLASVIWVFTRKGGDVQILRAGETVLTGFLPDSSRVWLEPGSALSWDESFGGTSREVSLSGHAFFDVRRDSLRPFIIESNGAQVHVLGTAFDVLQETDQSVVTVEEGRVAVYSASRDSVVLGEMERIAVGKSFGRKENVPDASFSAWRRTMNPQFDREVADAVSFIKTTSSWRKNSINMSVVEGTVTNTASLAAYSAIVLKIIYRKGNGTRGTMRVKINETLSPGEKVPFHGRLLDILSNTDLISVEVESLAVVD